jgi:hypothetical protein
MKHTANITDRTCYLPLRDAVLCADCEFISLDRGDSCAVCGGINLLKVCDVLGYSASDFRPDQTGLEFLMLTSGSEDSPENDRFVNRKGERHA